MPFEAHTNNEFLRPAIVKAYRSELRRSSKQHQSSKIEKPNFQDKFVIEKNCGRPHFQLYPETDQNVHGEILFQKKYPGNQRKHPPIRSKASSTDEEELVRHMSNLPGYLQRMDDGEKQQEKALNFGVLDWERLEKWKHRQMSMPARHNINAPSTSSNASSAFTTGGSYIRSSSMGSLSNGVKGTFIGVQDYEHFQKLFRTSESLIDSSSVVKTDKLNRKDVDQRVTSETGASSSKSTNYVFAGSSDKELHDLDFEFPSPCYPDKHQNIVLLLPRDSPRNSCSEPLRLSEPRSSIDRKMASMSRKSFSDAFYSRKGRSDELYPEVSRSGPLPCEAETISRGLKLPSDAYHASMQSKGNPTVQTEESKAKGKVLMNSTACEATKKLDREFASMTAGKGMTPSPDRRFGVAHGRMSRSSSWKESSAVPQLSSSCVTAKSGLVRSESSPNPNDANGEKTHAHIKGRASPLRRLLDPILKPKNTQHADTGPVQRNLNSVFSAPSCSSESVLKGQQASIHALLQLTVKNGLPLFKFVVDDNDSDILATTVKKYSQSEKDSPTWVYTFYSVHETKRKKKSGGWINQGSKEKCSGYTHKVVGQMKVSNSKDQNLKLSVLLGVEPEHANREVPAREHNGELAAIVTTSKIRSSNGDESEKRGEFLSQDGSFCASGENPCTVILPDGLHGLPNEGFPSPLIDRWKSGGSCDCGGWDIGCKLKVLSTPNVYHVDLGLFEAHPATDRLDLFVQGGNRDKKPAFGLIPLRSGIYSVNFNAAISSLQAFSICVAVMNGEEISNQSGISPASQEARRFPSSPTAGLRRTSPVRYVSYPPYSPVGRA